MSITENPNPNEFIDMLKVGTAMIVTGLMLLYLARPIINKLFPTKHKE